MPRDHDSDDPHLPILVEVLRSTLKELEEREELSPDDPALLEIKRSIVRAIAKREADGGEESAE